MKRAQERDKLLDCMTQWYNQEKNRDLTDDSCNMMLIVIKCSIDYYTGILALFTVNAEIIYRND